ncbi:MAG: 4Fe-4S binding protein [Desulfobacteraceae bacterium]
MVIVDPEKCTGCALCVQDCPLGAISLRKKKAFIAEEVCTQCGACVRVCPEGALSLEKEALSDSVMCEACPIGCLIKEGNQGACRRYMNQGGVLLRLTPLHYMEDVKEAVGPEPLETFSTPFITGIGAGTTYPDCRPAPYIVQGKRDQVDLVTVVTEAPLSYSGIMVKVDTDVPIGEEGAAVYAKKRKVGMVVTEQYGSKMLSIGGVNLLTGKDGLLVARTVTDIANKKQVRLRVEGGGRLEIKVGEEPVINGQRPGKMRVGCGSATLGLFAQLLERAADDVIVLDSHLTGLLSEHAAGRYVGVKPSGVRLRFRQSTPGRYFGDSGGGWGGTSITRPTEVIAGIDPKTGHPGMRILVTETTGERAAMLEVGEDWSLREVPLTEAAAEALEAISKTCEISLVSGLYMGGAGGSARAGVVRYPIRLTRAVHEGRARLTVGGARAFVLPGGGINFMVDVAKVKGPSFYWTPTPATICPIEYTMELKDYREMGGHVEAMRPFEALDPETRRE